MNRPLHVRLLGWLAKILAALVLLVATLWTGAYFALGSTPGREALAGVVQAQAPGVSPAVLRWGPAPSRLVVGGLRVGEGKPLAALTVASLEVGLWSLLGNEPVIERLHIELSHVHANIGPDGRVDLVMVLAPPRPSSRPPAAPRPRARPRLKIEALDVRIGEVLVMKGVEGVHVRDLALSGSVSLGDQVELALTAKTGPLHVAMDRGRRVWGASALSLDEVRASIPPAAPELSAVVKARVYRDGAELLRLAVAANPGGGAEGPITLSLDADLEAADLVALLPGADLPHGLQVAGLSLALAPGAPKGADPERPSTPSGRVRGHVERLFAPTLGLGQLALHHVSLSIAALDVDADRLIPQVEIRLGHLQAARLSGLGWDLEGLDFAGGDIALVRRLTFSLGPGHVADWVLPDGLRAGREGPLPIDELSLDGDLGLTGGPIVARLFGGFGAIEARGKLRMSPLTGKTGFGAEVAFAGLTGAPARALIPDLPEDHPLVRADVAASGSMTIELEDKAVAFDEGVVSWSSGTSRWDGYGWADDPDDPDDPTGPPEDSP